VTVAPSCLLAGAVCAATLAFGPPAGLAEDPDLDGKAVQAVCGRCHSTALFENKPRSWERWNDVFADMTQRGATGTDEQLTRVTRYFLENLTLVNVNSSPVDELTWVLGIREEVAQDIITRRSRQPFANLAQLLAVPGVDAAKVEQRKSRILF
jgi:hypothetical protein